MHVAAKVGLVFAVGGALVMTYFAIKKASPIANTGDPSKTPNRVSSSESTPFYNMLFGVGGSTPVISFPDISGVSANVTQPV